MKHNNFKNFYKKKFILKKMNAVFMSPDLKQEQRKFIQDSISRFDGGISQIENNATIIISPFRPNCSTKKKNRTAFCNIVFGL